MAGTENILRYSLEALLKKVRADGETAQKLLSGTNLMLKIFKNIAANPDEEKYHRVRKDQEAFSRVWKVAGWREFLILAGFVEDSEHIRFIWSASGVAACIDTLGEEMLNLEQLIHREAQENVKNNYSQSVQEELKRVEKMEKNLALDRATASLPPLGTIDNLAKLPSNVLELLLKVIRNICLNQNNEKYRKLRTENKTVKEILRHKPAWEQLQITGFDIDGEYMTWDPVRGAGCIHNALVGVEQALTLKIDEETRDFDDRAASLRSVPKADRSNLHNARPSGKAIPAEYQEQLLTATQLISDIQGLMEQDWLLKGAVGYTADFRKQGAAIHEQFKQGVLTITDLHDLKETWKGNIEATKAKTGRTMLNTIPVTLQADTQERIGNKRK